MDLKRLGGIARIFSEYNLTELELTEGENKLVLKKTISEPSVIYNKTQTEQKAFDSDIKNSTEKESLISEENTCDYDESKSVKAPLAGIVYLSPSPESKPFVSVGDSVKEGDTLCIIEAMKVMNEIISLSDGVISEICAENETLAEYGQVLFHLK